MSSSTPALFSCFLDGVQGAFLERLAPSHYREGRPVVTLLPPYREYQSPPYSPTIRLPPGEQNSWTRSALATLRTKLVSSNRSRNSR